MVVATHCTLHDSLYAWRTLQQVTRLILVLPSNLSAAQVPPWHSDPRKATLRCAVGGVRVVSQLRVQPRLHLGTQTRGPLCLGWVPILSIPDDNAQELAYGVYVCCVIPMAY